MLGSFDRNEGAFLRTLRTECNGVYKLHSPLVGLFEPNNILICIGGKSCWEIIWLWVCGEVLAQALNLCRSFWIMGVEMVSACWARGSNTLQGMNNNRAWNFGILAIVIYLLPCNYWQQFVCKYQRWLRIVLGLGQLLSWLTFAQFDDNCTLLF